MKEDINIKEYGDELDNSPILAQLQGKNSFSVPVGYFDDLENDILEKVKNQVVISRYGLLKSKAFYILAAASLIFVLGFFAFITFSKTHNQQIVERPLIQNPNSQNVNENNIISNISNQNLKSDLNIIPDSNIMIVEKIESPIILNSHNNIAIEKNNNPKQIVSTSEINLDQQTINSNNINTNFTKNNTISNISTIASVVSSSIPTSSQNIIKARLKERPGNNLFLPQDTCVNSPFTFDISSFIIQNPQLKFQWEGMKPGDNILISSSDIYTLHYWLGDSFSFYDTMQVRIQVKPEPKIKAVSEICSYNSVLIDAGISNTDYDYFWSISDKNNSEIYLENLKPGVHEIYLKVASCVDTVETKFVLRVLNCNIEVPNVFTPNGDGFNDSFIIKGLDNYPGSSLSILDRNGKVVYQSLDYKNNWRAENLPQGTYFYSLKINDENNTEKGGLINIIK